MKVLFQGRKPFVGLRGVVVMCVSLLSLLAAPAHAQTKDNGASDNRKMLYGIHLGFTENMVDLYYTQSGVAHAMEQGNHSFCVPGVRIAVIGDLQLGHCFSLRAMPGTTLIESKWRPDNVAVPALPTADYKVESVCGELPVDVKFHPFRKGNLQPYLASGFCYSLDFAALHGNNDSESILRLNVSDLRYTCGLGLDYNTRYLRVGVELKAGFGLLQPGTGSNDRGNSLYFKGGPTFSIGLNFEA